jgi:hypothetical protein
MNTISIKKIIIFSVLLLAFVLTSLKIYEYFQLTTYKDLYNETWRQELRITQISTEKYRETGKVVEAFYASSTGSADMQTEAYLNLDREINQAIDDNKYYIEVMEKNRNKYQSFIVIGIPLLNKDADKLNKIKNLQLEYYEEEIKKSRKALVGTYFYQNLFSTLNHMNIVNQFDSSLGNDLARDIENNYYIIAGLEKYTNPNFKFSNESDIKALYPDEYEALEKYRRYFSSYYDLIKSYQAGKSETAEYENLYNTLTRNGADLNVDFTSLLSVMEEEEREQQRKILQAVSNQILLISDLEKVVTPLDKLGNKSEYADELVQCQMYDYKVSAIEDKKVVSETVNNLQSLISLLDKYTPYTKEIDKQVNDLGMRIENTGTHLVFDCVDPNTEDHYIFYNSLQ